MGVLPGEPGVGAGFWTGRKNVSDCLLIHSFIHSKGRGVAYSARRGFAALAFLLVLGSGLVQMLVTERCEMGGRYGLLCPSGICWTGVPVGRGPSEVPLVASQSHGSVMVTDTGFVG